MKRILSLALVIISIICTLSCSKEKDRNPLVGTKWTTSYADDLMVLEFTSDKDVTGYFAKSSGAYLSGQIQGTYSFSNNNITFSNMTFRWMYAYYRLDSGTLSGSLLNTTGKETFNIDGGEWFDWKETWSK